jgi:PAS domain S-box-containing protein
MGQLHPSSSVQRVSSPPIPIPLEPKFDFEDFFENGGVALHLVGADGTILHANKAELNLVGYPAEEYIGRDIREIHADQDIIEDIMARLGRGEQINKYPAKLRTRDGLIKYVEITSSAQFKDGKFVHTRCFTLDVTDLIQARAEVRRKDEQLRQVLEALPAAVYTTDADGKITYFNRAAAELAGREPILGKDEWCVTYRLFTPDGKALPHHECPMAVTLKENRPVRGVEAMGQRPDGTLFPFLPFPTPLRAETGELVGAVNMLVDISERKEAETHQRMLLDELNHRVKNNLQMLSGLLNAAHRETTNKEAATILREASQRVAAMAAAQQLLYTDKNSKGFAIREFLHAVCESSRQVFGKEVTVTIDAEPGYLHNELSMPLALILNELLTNAAKYGADGNGQINVKVSLKRDGQNFALCVEDNGPGFEFTVARRRSSGLGLVAGLARQLLGTFKVERDGGTKCCVSFPANARTENR